jgi:hypothetical protein
MMVKLYRLQCRSLKAFLRPFTFVPDQMETIEIILVVIDLEMLEIVDEF